MRPQSAETRKDNTIGRMFWRIAFCIGAVPFVACLTCIAAQPIFGAVPHAVYWVAVASAVLCAIAAVRLRSYERYDAVDEGAWLARVGLKSTWDDLDGTDD